MAEPASRIVLAVLRNSSGISRIPAFARRWPSETASACEWPKPTACGLPSPPVCSVCAYHSQPSVVSSRRPCQPQFFFLCSAQPKTCCAPRAELPGCSPFSHVTLQPPPSFLWSDAQRLISRSAAASVGHGPVGHPRGRLKPDARLRTSSSAERSFTAFVVATRSPSAAASSWACAFSARRSGELRVRAATGASSGSKSAP